MPALWLGASQQGVCMLLKKHALVCLCIFTFLSVYASTAVLAAPNAAQANDQTMVQEVASALPFDTVKEKALQFITSKGLTVFAEYDHAKNAHGVKLELAPTTVIVFGSPMVGTKLMQSFPGIGMELPLKILITQKKDGRVYVSYENLAKVFAPYGVKGDNEILGKMQGLLKALAKNATQ